MLNLTPDLQPNETIVRETGATVYRVRNGLSSRGSNIRLWLTDRRLILKAGIGPQRALPLSHITGLAEAKVGWYNMLRVDFDDNHSEWFTVQDQAQFIPLLEQVRTKAPELPYEPAPPGMAGKLFGIPLLVMAVVVVVVVVACLCMVAFFLIAGLGFFWMGA
jgi:hypothetical protein